MRASLISALACVAASGVAGAAAPSRDDLAVGRGAEVAQAHCASCHAVALEARSPERDAPQFRVLSRLYSAQNLTDKLYEYAQAGHFEMPPVPLREDEIADVAAYIASLDGGSVAPPARRGDPVAEGRFDRAQGRSRRRGSLWPSSRSPAMILTLDQIARLRAFVEATDAQLLALLADHLTDGEGRSEVARLETLRGAALRLLAKAQTA